MTHPAKAWIVLLSATLTLSFFLKSPSEKEPIEYVPQKKTVDLVAALILVTPKNQPHNEHVLVTIPFN